MCKVFLPALSLCLVLSAPVMGQDWQQIEVLSHRQYQAVTETGAPAYTGGWPFRMVGVVLNDTQDWVDPTPGFHKNDNDGIFDMGGQAEIFVQAVNLDATQWDPDPAEAFDDFGGTACWIGQNIGEISGDWGLNYTDSKWQQELTRLNFYGPAGVTDPIRAGDLVEIRARAGLFYLGKYNVNEQHNPDPAKDFDIVRLEKGFGLPEAPELTLADLKDADDTFLFDLLRLEGPEHYQASRIKLTGLSLVDPANLQANTDVQVTDGDGRTFALHLCRGEGFDGSALAGLDETFHATGILDQKTPFGGDLTQGYRLLVLDAADIQVVPEPAILTMLLTAGAFLTRPRRHGRRNV